MRAQAMTTHFRVGIVDGAVYEESELADAAITREAGWTYTTAKTTALRSPART